MRFENRKIAPAIEFEEYNEPQFVKQRERLVATNKDGGKGNRCVLRW